MGDNAALLLRVGFSFSLVLGLMWIAARVLRSRTSGRPTDAVEVLARHQLGRGSAVTVLRVGDRALVLGITERSITQLGEPITDLTGLRNGVVPVEALPETTTDTATDVIRGGVTTDVIRNGFTTDVIRTGVSTDVVRGDLADLLPGPRSHARRRRSSSVPSAPQAMAGQGALSGSILSPATWRMGMDALRERTVRRG